MNRRLLRVPLALLAVVPVMGMKHVTTKPGATPPATARTAVDLYHAAGEEEGNLVFSPLSISAALAMCDAGARGRTGQEIAAVLHATPGTDLDATLGRRVHVLTGAGARRRYELRIADALWTAERFTVRPAFAARLRDAYGAESRSVPFAAAPDQARTTINTWVADQTHQRILDLLASGAVTPATRLVLTNAIYFKGSWASKFPAKATADDAFWMNADARVTVPFMHQTGEFGYATVGKVQALELPYAGGDLSMLVVLPTDRSGMGDLDAALTAANIARWRAALKPQHVDVTFPRFTCTTSLDLNDALRRLGMKAAFDARTADFSGIDGTRDLSVSKVVHKAFIQVDEEGSEAAAVTGIAIMASEYRPPSVFRADHPFVYAILDRHSGEILFLGRVLNPAG